MQNCRSLQSLFWRNQQDLRQILGVTGDRLLLGPFPPGSMNMAVPIVAFCLAESSSAVPALLVPNVLLVMNKPPFVWRAKLSSYPASPALPQVNVQESLRLTYSSLYLVLPLKINVTLTILQSTGSSPACRDFL